MQYVNPPQAVGDPLMAAGIASSPSAPRNGNPSGSKSVETAFARLRPFGPLRGPQAGDFDLYFLIEFLGLIWNKPIFYEECNCGMVKVPVGKEFYWIKKPEEEEIIKYAELNGIDSNFSVNP